MLFRVFAVLMGFVCLTGFFGFEGPFCERVKAAPVKKGVVLSQKIIDKNLEQQAVNHLEKVLKEQGEKRRYVIESVRIPKQLRLPPGNITYETTIKNGLRYHNMIQVIVQIFVNGEAYTSANCTMRVRVYEHMVSAARDIMPEKLITASDLRNDEREVDSRALKYYTVPDQVIGKVSNRLIKVGTILNQNMLRGPIIMYAGDEITLISNYNGVQIKTPGIATQPGREGIIIKVKNASSGKVLKGRVLDAHNVEIIN